MFKVKQKLSHHLSQTTSKKYFIAILRDLVKVTPWKVIIFSLEPVIVTYHIGFTRHLLKVPDEETFESFAGFLQQELKVKQKSISAKLIFLKYVHRQDVSESSKQFSLLDYSLLHLLLLGEFLFKGIVIFKLIFHFFKNPLYLPDFQIWLLVFVSSVVT